MRRFSLIPLVLVIAALFLAAPCRSGELRRVGLDLPVLLDADGATFRAWGGKGLPTSALVDGVGRLRYVGLGPLEWDGADAMTAIQELLSEMAAGE